MRVKHILREWLSERVKKRNLKKNIPPARGKLYYFFLGKRKLEVLEREARAGDVAAQVALASSLLFGAHGRLDARAASKWILKANAAGDPHAKFLYGCRHLTGVGVPEDRELAVQWWKEAAQGGDPQGCAHMAWAYHFGFGLRANTNEAVGWAFEAAIQGVSSAQYSIGMRYLRGGNMEKDPVKAYFWVRLAAKRKQRNAKRKNINEVLNFEPNPLGPIYGSASSQARKIRSRLKRDAVVAVEEAVKQWQPGQDYPDDLDHLRQDKQEL